MNPSDDPAYKQLMTQIEGLPLIGPVKFDLHLYITNGFRTATTRYTLPLGQLPTEEAVARARKVALDGASKKLGGFGWRELTKDEFVKQVLAETGKKSGGVIQ